MIPFIHLFSAIYRSYFTPFICNDRRGPPCTYVCLLGYVLKISTNSNPSARVYIICIYLMLDRWKMIYAPGTQMTLVLIGTDLVLEGSTTKIEDKQVPGEDICVYIYIQYIYDTYIYYHTYKLTIHWCNIAFFLFHHQQISWWTLGVAITPPGRGQGNMSMRSVVVLVP